MQDFTKFEDYKIHCLSFLTIEMGKTNCEFKLITNLSCFTDSRLCLRREKYASQII